MIDLDQAADLVPDDELNAALWDLGHFHLTDAGGFRYVGPRRVDVLNLPRTSSTVRRAIKSYQSFRPGLKVDGLFLRETLARYAGEATGGLMRCGCPDVMERRADRSQFPDSCKTTLKVAIEGYDGEGDWREIDYPQNRDWTFRDAIDKALAFWNDICGIHIELVPWSRRNEAQVHIDAGRLSGSILAWMELAINRCDVVLNGRMNTNVNWAFFILWTTLAHEHGHAWGLAHTNKRGNIMYPSHDPDYDGLPGDWERAQMVGRYGKPIAPPDPVDPPDDLGQTINITGTIRPGVKEYVLVEAIKDGF